MSYRHNDARPKEFRMRVSAVGGRALETKDAQVCERERERERKREREREREGQDERESERE